MADDDFNLEAEDYRDPAASFASGIVIVTSVLLLAAFVVMNMACQEYYGVGVF